MKENNLKQLEREMKNLIITHSPSIENDNIFSGEMEKYCFEYPVNCRLEEEKLVIQEKETNQDLCLELSEIVDISPISKNDKFVFSQEYVCTLLYKGKEVITFYFD